MKHNFWVKTTNLKIFGKTIFSKEEICNDTERESDYTIIVSPEYFDSEFDMEQRRKRG